MKQRRATASRVLSGQYQSHTETQHLRTLSSSSSEREQERARLIDEIHLIERTRAMVRRLFPEIVKHGRR